MSICLVRYVLHSCIKLTTYTTEDRRQNTEHRTQNTEHGKQNTETHKTTYVHLIDTALYVMFLMQANQLLGQVGKGLGPGNLVFFRPQMALA
jgi:hypothetical protein